MLNYVFIIGKAKKKRITNKKKKSKKFEEEKLFGAKVD